MEHKSTKHPQNPKNKNKNSGQNKKKKKETQSGQKIVTLSHQTESSENHKNCK